MAGRSAGSQRSVAAPLAMAALVVAVLAVVVGGLATTGRSRAPSPPAPTAPEAAATPQPTAPPTDEAGAVAAVATEYLAAWELGDWQAMKALVADPPPDFASRHVVWHGALNLARMSLVPGIPAVAADGATVPFAARLEIRGLGDWRYDGRLALARHGGHWLVKWSPATIHPLLADGLEWQVTRARLPRAPILDRHGRALAAPVDIVTVGIEPGRASDRAALTAAVDEHLQIPASVVDARLDAPGVRSDWFLPLAELTPDRWTELEPALRPVPGLVFRRGRERVVATEELAGHLVGRIGEITAELLDRLGSVYQPGDVVGRSGLELAFEPVLGGRPGGDLRLVDASGKQVLRHEFPSIEPTAVHTTLDLEVQLAAEAALAGVPAPAAIVAVDAADGGVLAVAATPPDEFNRALAGRYPPGSTFKIVTAAAAVAGGTKPADTVACPETVEVDGRTFRNASSVTAGDGTLTDVFAHSCNTAFIGLATEVGSEALAAAAASFGFDAPYALPVPSFGGRFPQPEGPVALAAAAIGQANVEASPLHMASVAAAVASGEWRTPRLVAGQPRAAHRLAPDVAGPLRDMMRAVVEDGTGARLAGSGEVHGKTGSAQFDGGRPDDTHAWFVGYRGRVAFAVLVEEGGSGGTAAAPVAAAFLEYLGAQTSSSS